MALAMYLASSWCVQTMTLFLATFRPWSWSAVQVSARQATMRRRKARRLACRRCDRSSTQMRCWRSG
eukprot:1222913-Pyramimonas_sp.AAC.1